MTAYGASLAGGMLIGLSAAILLAFNGRVAGISGIVGRLAQGSQFPTNAAFAVGLVSGPILFLTVYGRWPDATITSSLMLLIVAGFLVGFGSRVGSGCTSGHGVVGLARLSPRSAVAVVTFVAAGISTVTIMRFFGL
jgi:uncharacterized membrane protein YedE/YeeE